MEKPKYFIVEAKALPEIFWKVAQAKQRLETGQAATVQEATRDLGISRSAFYKYRDAIFPFRDMMAGRILTFRFLLRDEPGLLSVLLSIFAQFGANILTIHQTVPTDGRATVAISADTTRLSVGVEVLLRQLGDTNGVYKAELLAG